MQDEFDPKVNRGVLPKDWHRCEVCGTTRAERHLNNVAGEWKCINEESCREFFGDRVFGDLTEEAKTVDVSPHRWFYCVTCSSFVVLCANCGNNCCNGGSESGCADTCEDAYQKQETALRAIAGIQERREQCRAERKAEREASVAVAHATGGVLDEVRLERERQDAKWGVQNHPDLSPRRDRSYPERTAEEMQIPSAHTARSCCEHLAARGELGFADIALEEFAESIEAAALGDVVELRKELVQTAAVIVAWIESIDRRGAKP